jgi:protein-tyrosine phosphatase
MRILFVCTGNVFRSLSAELLLKDYLKKEGIRGIVVASTGTVAAPDVVGAAVLSELSCFGIDASLHKQTHLTKEIAKSYDLVIAMAEYHQAYIKDNYGIDAPLFNEFCYGKSLSIWDVNDVLGSGYNSKAEENYIRKTIRYIHDSMPIFIKNLKR